MAGDDDMFQDRIDWWKERKEEEKKVGDMMKESEKKYKILKSDFDKLRSDNGKLQKDHSKLQTVTVNFRLIILN